MATMLVQTHEDGTFTIVRPLTPSEVRSRRGKLRPATVQRYREGTGRRNRSPYEARALGSGEGVLAPKDATFTRNPQSCSGQYVPGTATL